MPRRSVRRRLRHTRGDLRTSNLISSQYESCYLMLPLHGTGTQVRRRQGVLGHCEGERPAYAVPGDLGDQKQQAQGAVTYHQTMRLRM